MQPEDLAQAITESSRIPTHERVVHEYRFFRRDGSEVWIHDEFGCCATSPAGRTGWWARGRRSPSEADGNRLLRTQRLERVGAGQRHRP